MSYVNIIYMERQLRAGKTPVELGATLIGKGAQKKAYRLGNVVIKSLQLGWGDNSKRPPKGIAKFNARFVRSYRAGSWSIQEFVTPLRDFKSGNWNIDKASEVYNNWKRLYTSGLGDLHEYNCGVSSTGDLVVFDW